MPKLPHKIGSRISPQEMYSYDALTIPANLAGICALSLPAGKIDGCPIGLQVMCNSFSEQKLFQIAKAIENLGKK